MRKTGKFKAFILDSMFGYKVQFRLHIRLHLGGYNFPALVDSICFSSPLRISANPFPVWPAFPSSEYYGLVRLPDYLLIHPPVFRLFADCPFRGIVWFSQVPDNSICYHAMASDPGEYC